MQEQNLWDSEPEKCSIDLASANFYFSYIALKHTEFEMLKSLNFKEDGNWTMYTIPCYTLASFACELSLKSKTKDDIPRTHDLKRLFLELSEDFQETIKDKTIALYNKRMDLFGESPHINKNSFFKKLDENKRIFEEIRYHYENDCRKLDLNFIEALMFVLLEPGDERYIEFIMKILPPAKKSNDK